MAVKRIEYLAGGGREPRNVYGSIDPTPPTREEDIKKLENTLLDESKSLYERYAAMFALRDLGTDGSALALTKGTTISFPGITYEKNEVVSICPLSIRRSFLR